MNAKTMMVAFLVILMGISNLTFANDTKIPIERIKFITYYETSVTPDSPATIIVVFYGEKPTSQQVETFLRNTIAMSLIIESPETDILAMAIYDAKDSAISDEDNQLNEETLEPNLLYKASDKTTKIYKPF